MKHLTNQLIRTLAFTAVIFFFVSPWPANGDRKADVLLHDQLEKMNVEGVRQALRLGANPNALKDPFSQNNTPLSMLAWQAMVHEYDHPKVEDTALEIADLLFAEGAKVHQIYDRGILFFPIAKGFARFVDLLIRNGADPWRKIDGQTPMKWAVHYEQPEVVEVLNSHGVPIINKRMAAQIRFISAAERSDIKGMNTALVNGADINGKNDRDQTALIVMLRSPIYKMDQSRAIKYLLGLGADPNIVGESLLSGVDGIPIHVAVVMNRLTLNKPRGNSRELATLVIEQLLEHEARVAHRDSQGRTPLHIAAKTDNVLAAKLLMEHGSTIMTRDKLGNSPLDYAESAEMIRLLKGHGARE